MNPEEVAWQNIDGQLAQAGNAGITLPPLEEQRRIVREVERRLESVRGGSPRWRWG